MIRGRLGGLLGAAGGLGGAEAAAGPGHGGGAAELRGDLGGVPGLTLGTRRSALGAREGPTQTKGPWRTWRKLAVPGIERQKKDAGVVATDVSNSSPWL